MRFKFLSAISLIGCAVTVFADLSVLQNTVREQLFAHRDFELALRRLEYGGRDNPYPAVEEVLQYHRQLNEAVRRGSSSLRSGPNIGALEATQISLIADLVIQPLQQNMNSLIRYKGAFDATRKVPDMYRSLQESLDAHNGFADALASKVPGIDGVVVQMGSRARFVTHIQNAITVYQTSNSGW